MWKWFDEKAADIEEATPRDRIRYADLLRVGAIALVVLGHWLAPHISPFGDTFRLRLVHAALEPGLMPRDTAIFDTGELDKTFVHGGNSLQERLVPVLQLEYRRAVGGSTAEYEIAVRVGASLMDMHCLELMVSPQQGMLDRARWSCRFARRRE